MDFLFSDTENVFQLLNYSPSHSQLVIRSMRNRQREFNIDILFKGVSFLEVPTVMKGLSISSSREVRNEQFKKSKDHVGYILTDTEENCFYVTALSFFVFHSKVDILETIIGRYDSGEFMEEMVL